MEIFNFASESIGTELTIVDYVFLCVVGISLILGIWKGLLKQIFALVGVFVVALGTTYLSPYPNEWLKNVIEADGTRSIVAMAATFVVLLVVYGIITKLISKAVNKSNTLGWINRLLGAVFAVVVVYLIFSVIVALLFGTADEFLQGTKKLLKVPFEESNIINNVYGGTENPDKNFFGNWVLNALKEKISEIMPDVPEIPQLSIG